MTRAAGWMCAVFLLALTIRASAHDPITTKVTWSKEIVRIVNTNCAGCHTSGGVAPMSLATYDAARPWAKAIRDEVVSRRMPRWPAARGFGHFSNDPTLSPFEIELIAAWADGGAPKGDDRDLPAKSSSAESAKPDAALALPARANAPAGDSRTVTIDPRNANDRWITAWEFVPNDGAIVHAEFVLNGREILGRWSPPQGRVTFPPRSGERLAPGAAIQARLTYRSAKEQQDFPIALPTAAPQLRLFLTTTRPAQEVRQQVEACASDARPPATPATPVSLESPVQVFAVDVTGAEDGSSVGLLLAAGARPPQPLAWIQSFIADYQPTYRFAAPISANLQALHTDAPRAGAACLVTWSYLAAR